jgi:hypothetical protein
LHDVSPLRCRVTQDKRKFVAKEIREEGNRVCYEIWVEHALLVVVWISARQRATYGSKFLEDWCRRHEERLKNAGIVDIDLDNETLD